MPTAGHTAGRARIRLVLSHSGRLAIVAALAGGCTHAPGQPAPEAMTAPAPIVAAATTMPLDRYAPRPAEANDLDVVVKRLTTACMRRFGQAWRGGARNDFDLLRDRANRFGLADDGLASGFGYHWDIAPAAPASPQQAPYLHGGAPGVPAGGCAGEADARLGWQPAEFTWLQQLRDRTMTLTYADPRATAATRRWSECMTKTGFPYAVPADAETDPRWKQGTAPSAEEKRTALADVRCKQETGFVGRLTVVLAEQQARAVEENTPRLDAFRRMSVAAAARADALRGDSSPTVPAPSGSTSTPLPPGMWRTKETTA
ncbi:hypothetical protein KOI35_18215 [Actinoplanes bogorensis]|uniref:Uncharacterized protein n=1 Tax=Paractinoplanes bogorensis TaxID=1610840 RepID=A0ABS5YQ37_9ACTN|nr:hypothetical protein [Actinoplanes bogorensis]MBU2665446.1 hypothetical protein [Actinoplanes bogorensis]